MFAAFVVPFVVVQWAVPTTGWTDEAAKEVHTVAAGVIPLFLLALVVDLKLFGQAALSRGTWLVVAIELGAFVAVGEGLAFRGISRPNTAAGLTPTVCGLLAGGINLTLVLAFIRAQRELRHQRTPSPLTLSEAADTVRMASSVHQPE